MPMLVPSLKPRSILQLTIIGFLTVAAPLVAALFLTVQQLDLLGNRSRQAVFDVAAALRAGRVLVEQTLAMERNARQYVVLGDPALMDVYTHRQKEFLRAVNLLTMMRISPEIDGYAQRLVRGERGAFAAMRRLPTGTPVGADTLPQFPSLLENANKVNHAINAWIDRELLELRLQVDNTQRLIFFQALTLVSVALVLAGMFTALITRPLKQIDRAIRQLGDGGLSPDVLVDGPLDLQELGVRLGWLRTRLDELEQQRVSFLRNVSHELKTPLTAILEGVALLNDRLVGPLTGRQVEVVAIVRKQCRRLQRLIEDLLRFNTGMPAANVELREVRLDEIVQRVATDHALAMKSGEISMSSRLDPITVRGDAEQIRTVVDNLVANAIKYSPRNGTIALAVRGEGGKAVLEVRDQGPGIPGRQREKVFQAFFQGSPPSKKHVKGTGLGLAIARDYLKLHGGDIQILDSAHGAHFRVTIPEFSQAAR